MSRILRLAFIGTCLASGVAAAATLITWQRSYKQLESVFFVYNSPRSSGSGTTQPSRTVGMGRASWFGGELHLSWEHRTGLSSQVKWLSGASTGFEWSQYPVRLITWPGRPKVPKPDFPRLQFGFVHASNPGRWKVEVSIPQWFVLCLLLLLPGVRVGFRVRGLLVARRQPSELDSETSSGAVQ